METKRLIEESDVGLGIEIEIENQHAVRGSKFWHCKEDNSLRRGVEFVFLKPFNGKKSLQALEEFYTEHLHKDAQISARTGTHVHIDVSKCTNPQIQKMCIFYALLEEILFEWVGDARA